MGYTLGIWDGHDAGAALLQDGKILYAANEERFTKRKLEINFPNHAISAAISYAKIKHSDVDNIAYSTTEFTKTLERIFPSMKENYYKFRRRKILKPMFENARHKIKYTLTGIGPLPLCEAASSHIINRKLKRMGFRGYRLYAIDHHLSHAACAAFTSGQGRKLVITLDGLGDGLSGSVSILDNGKLERVMRIGAQDSLGIFYEQITNIVGMRELEDEGKVMAMADYSYPFSSEENRFSDLFSLSGTRLRARHSAARQYDILSAIGWQMPREQFAYMAQQLVEMLVEKLISNLIDRYNIQDIAVSGGLFSNIKANMKVRSLGNVKSMYVFPHMGDGGIALGAALYCHYLTDKISGQKFSAYLGDEYSEEDTVDYIKKHKEFSYNIEGKTESARHASELISKENYILWFNGRMEYGPRALGNRSIVGSSSSEQVKELLNMKVKRREWFQPFAPSVLESEVERLFEYDNKGYDKFMTSAYAMKKEHLMRERSVVHVDGTARPQMVGDENLEYKELLAGVKKQTGFGIVLNTSFNIHGSPIVMSPSDALLMMKQSGTKHMFINGVFVTNRKIR